MRALVAAGGLLGLLLLGLAAAPAVVRGKVEAAASARGLTAEVDEVSWGLGRIWLRGVDVAAPGEDLKLRVEAVSVGLVSGAVEATGGLLSGQGDPGALLKKLRGREEVRASSGGGGRDVSVKGMFVRWRQDGADVELFGARAARVDGGWTFGADLLRASAPGRSIEARGLEVGLGVQDGQRRVTRVATKGVELTVRGTPQLDKSASRDVPVARGPPSDDEVPRAERLRQLRALLLPLLRDGLSVGASLALNGVSARIERGGETLSFGPSQLALQRERDLLRVSLVPSATEAGVTPLAVSAVVPLSSGPVHVVAKGGPVSLASLGIREGQLGLTGVRQAGLEADGVVDFSEDFEQASVDGKLALRALSIRRRELAPQGVGPWSFDVLLKASMRLDGSEVAVTSSELHFGDVRAELSGQVVRAPGRRHVDGRFRVPLSGCQSVLEALPSGLLPLVRGVRLTGSFGIDLQVNYDLQAPQDARVVLGVQNECRIVDVPLELSPRKFERPFLREVKGPDGSPLTIESGPGTPSWVSIDDMSRHLETAVLICEDSRFHAHAGFDFRALESAIKDDLRQGKFARGASTVTMQLAKNLYLGKEKTLGRKLQEAVLTVLLEQQLDKRRILELYLNVVELGPGLYGVGDAAQYYFATPARALTLGQSLYLASLLPSPTSSRFGPNGKLSPSWLSYLHRLMHIAHKIKRIDDSELQAALEEEIAFRVPGSAAAAEMGEAASTPDAPEPPELDENGP